MFFVNILFAIVLFPYCSLRMDFYDGRERMKKITLFVFLLTCILGGCGQKEGIQESTPTPTLEAKVISVIQTSGGASTPAPVVEDETKTPVFVYDKFDGEVDSLAVAEDGTIYAICRQEESVYYPQNKVVKIRKPKQLLYAFDENGACLWRVEIVLPTVMQKMVLGVRYEVKQEVVLEWADGFLYLVLPGVDKMPVLYQFSPETWEWQEIYRFEKFSEIHHLVFMEEKLYVQGILANPSEKEFVQKPEYVEQYQHLYDGQAIGYLDMGNTEAGVTLLSIDVPSDMIKLTEDTLGIYQTGDEFWSLWKYMPAKETWEKTDIGVCYYRSLPEEVSERCPTCKYFVGYEDGCIYVKNGQDICYETPDGTELSLFTSDASIQYLKSDGTFLYYYIQRGDLSEIRRLCIRELFERGTSNPPF